MLGVLAVCQASCMDHKTLSFIALAITMLYGVGFAVVDDKSVYAPVGGVIVALAWIAVGMFSRDRADSGIDERR